MADRRVVPDRRAGSIDRRATGHWNDRRHDKRKRIWFDRAIAALPALAGPNRISTSAAVIRATIATEYGDIPNTDDEVAIVPPAPVDRTNYPVEEQEMPL